MNFNYIFENNNCDTNLLLEHGFQIKKSEYVLKRDFSEDFYIIFRISDKCFDVRAYDSSNNEEYMRFYNKSIKVKVLRYVKEKYNTSPVFPWKEYPTFSTLNESKKNKWYALIMNIPLKLLLPEKKSSVDVINVKLDSAKIKNLVDKVSFFPAYHMNKKYWITILLNSDIPFEKITELIDESYDLVTKK